MHIVFPIGFLGLFLAMTVFVVILVSRSSGSKSNRAKTYQSAEQLRNAWNQLDRVELRIAALEASVIERAGHGREGVPPYAASASASDAQTTAKTGREL